MDRSDEVNLRGPMRGARSAWVDARGATPRNLIRGGRSEETYPRTLNLGAPSPGRIVGADLRGSTRGV